MPQIESQVKYLFKKNSTAEAEPWWVPGGTTYARALQEEHGITNLSKFTVFVDGNPLSSADLNSPMRNGVSITLQTRNYDSGKKDGKVVLNKCIVVFGDIAA